MPTNIVMIFSIKVTLGSAPITLAQLVPRASISSVVAGFHTKSKDALEE